MIEKNYYYVDKTLMIKEKRLSCYKSILKISKTVRLSYGIKCIIEEIAKEFNRHSYVLKSNAIMPKAAEKYESIMNEAGEAFEYATAITDKIAFPKAYRSNTSLNSIVRELIETADMGVKKEIESLIEGGTIEKPVHEDITYGDIHQSQDNLWFFFNRLFKNGGKEI